MSKQMRRTLNDGVEIPLLGLGVFRCEDGRQTADCVRWALESGYRHIDTAALYKNEKGVGEGVRQSGIVREEVFITTKVWVDDMRGGHTRRGLENSLTLLGMDYVDLYLIHWPIEDGYVEAFEQMAAMKQEGLIRSIGVSNCHARHLDELIEKTGIVPAVNQIEIHPHLTQQPLVAYGEALGCVSMAYSPLAQGKLFDDPVLTQIAASYDKTVAQVMVRWNLQRGVITIPKSVSQARIQSNGDVFSFELAEQDMQKIFALNQNIHYGPDPDKRTY